MADPKPKLRWFQFSLRTLLVVVTLCAIACSWFSVKMRQIRREREAVAAIEAANENLKRQQEEAVVVRQLGGAVRWSARSIPVLRVGQGDDLFPVVVEVSTDRGPDKGTYWDVTDADLKNLREFSELEILDLSCSEQITSVGLENLEGLRKLRELDLSVVIQLKDDDLKFIEGLDQLRILKLNGNYRITDAGLERLKGLRHLQRLEICRDGQITEEGIKKLQRALPNCEICR